MVEKITLYSMSLLFEWAFGKRLTPQEKLRRNQRALEKTQRELGKEVTKLEAQEKKLISEIKKSAKQGQSSSAKIQAKDLIRTRNYVQKFNALKVQLQAILLRIQSIRSNQQMAMSMKDATRLLNGMNRSMNLPQLSRIVQEFEKQNTMMDQKQEFIDEAIDDTMAEEDGELGEEEQADEMVNKVFEEIGVELNSSLQDTPSQLVASPGKTDNRERVAEPVGGQEKNDVDNLQTRLNNLKK